MERVKSKVLEASREAKRVSKEDPRRVVHCLKVGLALAIVSSFYYFQPLYDNFGVSAMWAVMTVVVVFEFSVGATLGKGLNRGVATLLAGALGVGAHHLASLSGQTGEPILLAIFVFILAAGFTFIRFFPKIKARYDYGLMIFILTFSLISVSGFRDDEILELAHKRLSTVIIGGLACVIISIFVCPVWAGEDLHNLVANNLDKLGDFLEGFEDAYFAVKDCETENNEKRPNLDGYKSVLNSKSSEETLANFARWEPCHGRFRFRHPWKQYLAVGALTRQCAYRLDTLNAYLKAGASEINKRIEEPFRKMSSESGKALKEMSMAIKKTHKPSSSDSHVKASQSAAKTLNCLLKSELWKDAELLQVIPVAAAASLLADVVNLTEKISESVYELASSARFKDEIDPTVSPEKFKDRSAHERPEKSRSLKDSSAYERPHVGVSINDAKTKHDDGNLLDVSVHETSSSERKREDVEFGCPHVVIRVDGSNPKNPKSGVTNLDSHAANVSRGL